MIYARHFMGYAPDAPTLRIFRRFSAGAARAKAVSVCSSPLAESMDTFFGPRSAEKRSKNRE